MLVIRILCLLCINECLFMVGLCLIYELIGKWESLILSIYTRNVNRQLMHSQLLAILLSPFVMISSVNID